MNFRTHTATTRISVLALTVFFAIVPLLYAHADARDSVRTVLRPAPVSIPSPSPVPPPVPTPAPPPPSGGITSTTNGSVDSGGNTGGNITTGDEHIDVHEVNIGPTNPPPPPPPPSASQSETPPAPQCDLRTRTGCPTQDAGRAR
jgi:hypothetical protein